MNWIIMPRICLREKLHEEYAVDCKPVYSLNDLKYNKALNWENTISSNAGIRNDLKMLELLLWPPISPCRKPLHVLLFSNWSILMNRRKLYTSQLTMDLMGYSLYRCASGFLHRVNELFFAFIRPTYISCSVDNSNCGILGAPISFVGRKCDVFTIPPKPGWSRKFLH